MLGRIFNEVGFPFSLATFLHLFSLILFFNSSPFIENDHSNEWLS